MMFDDVICALNKHLDIISYTVDSSGYIIIITLPDNPGFTLRVEYKENNTFTVIILKNGHIYRDGPPNHSWIVDFDDENTEEDFMNHVCDCIYGLG